MSNPTVGHTFQAAGGLTGRVNPSGTVLEGPFTPTTPFIPNDPTLGTLKQLALRYVGANPTSKGPGETGFGGGESTPMQQLLDLVEAPSNPLNLDPAAVTATAVSINKGFNSCTEYYDMNCVLIGGSVASVWVSALHDKVFPPAAQPTPTPAPKPAPAPQPAPPPVPPVSTQSTSLVGGRFTVTVPSFSTTTGQNGFGTAVPLNDRECLFWFFSPDNIEITFTLINSGNDNWWTKVAAATNVHFVLKCTDTKTSKTWEYTNIMNHQLGVIDTQAFVNS